MTKIKITSLAHDMVGNVATVRAEVMEDAGGFFRVKDTIELEIEGGARMTSAQLETAVRERYHG
jgi:hypothetical protein